jgi:hypothetical protein
VCILEAQARAIRQEKKEKKQKKKEDWKSKAVFAGDTEKNPKECMKKLLELINELSKAAGFKIYSILLIIRKYNF